MILMGGASMYKDQNGWQSARAISCLPPLTGKLGKAGAGFGPRHAGAPHGHGFADILNLAAKPPGNYIPAQMSTHPRCDRDTPNPSHAAARRRLRVLLR